MTDYRVVLVCSDGTEVRLRYVEYQEADHTPPPIATYRPLSVDERNELKQQRKVSH